MRQRLEDLKKELARRLGPVLPDVPTGQFEELIDIVASMQLTYDSRRQAEGEGEPPKDEEAPRGSSGSQ